MGTAGRPLIGTSWKMNLTPSQARAYVGTFRGLVADLDDRDLFLLPALPAIPTVRDALRGTRIAWGAQDVHPEDSGAYTGDVSAPMLADLGCRYIEVGHPERRRDHGETLELVAAKVAAVVRWGMVPIISVGEAERNPETLALTQVRDELARALEAVDATTTELVVAYEPRWAIGAGRAAAEPERVGAMQAGLRAWLTDSGLPHGRVRVIYGGSVDESVAASLLAQPGVDGLFVGRAGLDPFTFAAIARTPLGVSGRPTR